MSEFPDYDEIHVISDIHMGGKPGFQILRQTGRLANFIGWVGARRPTERVALILNGDIIDTLAEDTNGYIAVDNALPILDRIMGDSAFAPVWDALAAFVKREGRRLVFAIGNHDIEIAFPNVQWRLLERLCGDDARARARVEFSTAGAGYACTVGHARVFCTHGNEVDAWNFNRYEELSKAARRINSARGLPLDEWTANAGTRMVKDVMNEVKKRYAWIDLLKPENSAAIGTLLALDPSQLGKLSKLPAIVGRQAVDATQVDQRLSAEGLHAPAPTAAVPSLESLLGPNVLESMQSVGARPGRTGDEMLAALELDSTDRPVNTFGDAPLGAGQLVWDRLTGWLTGVSPDEALRRALQDWLKNDTTFDLAAADATYAETVKKLGSAVNFVVTGHTHLERAIDMGAGRFYFNCGTWIRLVRFTEAMLAGSAVFKPIYDVLKTGSMAALDDAHFNGQSLVLDRTSAVSISLENGHAVGRLTHVIGDGSGQPEIVKQFS
ncbi:metallophosphoesterase [uncultured Thiodictyon sp.]|uniref:metallophosphoesterase n=1 Tax=uncultured Thiodictyon sp. TaxID=1846217 RepID=UPI0025F32840|nr:metallophosphoesterase [uncultured Thiodictyon sp.]